MWPGGFIVIALLLSIAAIAFAPGAPWLALPLVLILLVVGWLMNTSRQRGKFGGVRGMREQAQTADQDSAEVEFSDRDKQSLYTR
jgi:hypothetical protein